MKVPGPCQPGPRPPGPRVGPPLQGSPCAAEHSPQPPSLAQQTHVTQMPGVSPRQQGSSPSSQETQPSPSLRLSSPVVDWLSQQSRPPCSQAMTVSSIPAQCLGPLGTQETQCPDGTGRRAPNSRDTPGKLRGPPVSPGLGFREATSPGSRRDRLAPCCCLPGQLASLGQCGSLPGGEPKLRHSSSSSRSGSNRPGNPVPPGPSGEPLPLGTTARGTMESWEALGRSPPQSSPRRLRAPGIPINQVRRGDPRGQGRGWSGGQGWEVADPALTGPCVFSPRSTSDSRQPGEGQSPVQ